jgi:hypothetical protein
VSGSDRADRAAQTQTRLRRAYLWLCAAATLHVATLGWAVSLTLRGPAWFVELAAVAGITATSWALLWWRERRHSRLNQPVRWPARTIPVAIAQLASLGISEFGPQGELGLLPWQIVALLALSPFVQIGLVVRASRSLRHPLTPDLGETNVEIVVKPRGTRPWEPSWLSNDDITLSDSEIRIILRPDPRRGAAYRVALDLANVVSVKARAARDSDSPWMKLPDGYRYHTSPGEVVDINTANGSLVLPVHEAAAFAVLIEIRVARVVQMRAKSPAA